MTPFNLAKEQGYSDTEILDHLKNDSTFSEKIELARKNGYQDQEIVAHLSKPINESSQKDLRDEPKRKELLTEKYTKRPKEILTTAAFHGVRSLPRTVFDLIKMGAEKIGMDTSELEKAQEDNPDWVKKAARAVFPTYEQSKQQFNLGSDVVPEGAFEKGLEKAGRFAGESVFTGGLGGLRGAGAIVGAATGAQVGEELDLNPWAQLGLTLIGGKAGSSTAKGASGLSKQKITPEVEAYVQASKDLGIDPLLTGMNPSQLQKVAQKWATHGRGGPEILKEAYTQRSNQVSKAFEKAMEQAGEELFTTPLEAGEGLREGIKNATKQVEFNKSQLYRAVDKTLPPDAVITLKDTSPIRAHLNKASQALEDTLLMTPPQSITYSRVNKLIDDLEEFAKYSDNEIPVKSLEATNRSLHEVIRYDKPGGADKLLIPLSKEIGNELNRYGKTNPQYDAARKAANEYFSNDVVHIRQNLLQSIARSERPESTLALLNTESGIKNLEKALKSLPDGERMFSALKRYKLQSILKDKLFDPATGLMKVDGLKNFLNKKGSEYSVFEKLAGPEGIRTLKLLQEAGKGLEKGFNNLVNPSKTADTLIALNAVLSPGKKIISGTNKLFKGNIIEGPLEAAAGISQIIIPKIVAKKILDPKFSEEVFQLSKAAEAKDWKIFNRILDRIDEELKKENE